jgi:DNA-binding transcriptional regulator YiaG
MNKLPKPKHKLGYPSSQVKQILKELKISKEDFGRAFGVNTCAISKTGERIIYPCDIERALFNLGCKLGKNHLWD